MRTYTNETPPDEVGTCILAYGKTGCGKTRSLGTAPDPIYITNTEDKDPRNVLVGCPKKIFYFEFDNFNEQGDNVNQWITAAREGRFPAKTVCMDGLTFGQIKMNQEMEDDRYLIKLGTGKSRGLIDRAAIEEKDWGTGNKLLIRMMGLYKTLSKLGVLVIFTATEGMFQGEISPAVSGKQVPSALHGFFDFIGRIDNGFHYGENFVPIPATIRFEPPPAKKDEIYAGEPFMHRCTGEKLARAGSVPLHWGKILGMIKEEQRELWERAGKESNPTLAKEGGD